MCMICMFSVVIDQDSCVFFFCVFFFQAEDGIRDLVRSRGLGDVYKRQDLNGDGFCDFSQTSTSMATDTAADEPHQGDATNHLSLIHI